VSLNEQRPLPAGVRDARTLRRWYWLRSELVEIARGNGVGTSGGKLELTDRICAHFEQRPPAPPAARARSRDALPADLTAGVVLPQGQRCTRRLRTWMRAQVGRAFAFDAPMREAVGAGGITLGDLVGHWHATRGQVSREIGPQFELNRFSRAWHIGHPDGTHAQMLAEWAQHRSRPRDSGESTGCRDDGRAIRDRETPNTLAPMARVLITGMSGAGKTTVLHELSRRGHRTIDTDYDGWTLPDGNWDESRMSAILASEPSVVISGTAENQGRFYGRFSAVILLSAPVEVLIERVSTRTTNPYGTSEADQTEIRRLVRDVEPRLRSGATLVLDGRRSVAELADEIERLIAASDRT